MFDVLRIREETSVADIAFLDEIDSTNSFAMKQLEQSPVESPWLVLADKQTAGRGRGTNQWWASDGALTFSLAIESERFGCGSNLQSVAFDRTCRLSGNRTICASG